MLLAVMDLGSNSFKMTVAEWSPEARLNPFRLLHKERHPIQLGKSVFSKGRIAEGDFRNGLKALEKMQIRLRDFASPVFRAVATSAIRDSSNGRDFVQQARMKLGIPVEVISGGEEARLISHGLQLEYPRVRRGLLIDIGGGSTEVASFGRGWTEPFCHSFRMGSVRLATQAFNRGKKVDLDKSRRAIQTHLAKFTPPTRIEKLVGSAGTIQSLGDILCGTRSTKIIRRSTLDRWIRAHAAKNPSYLQKRFGVTPSRARVLVPGAVILSETMAWLGRDDLTVTQMTLRDGLMVDLVERWQVSEKRILKRRPTLPSKTAVRQALSDRAMLKFLETTARRFGMDQNHAAHIAGLSLAIFDQLSAQGFPLLPEDRKILLAAAYLHDIGRIISEGGHQKHGAYILRNLEWPDFTPLDARKIALVASYHRKDPPPKKDPLPGDIRGVHAAQVRRLAAVLRLADGLDEHHSQNVRAVHLRLSRKQVLMELVQTKATSNGEMSYFRDKAAYFEQLFGAKIVSFVKPRRR